MSKKFLIRLGMIVTVVAIAIGGTVAYFSDTEVSGNNVSSAGTFDIVEDGGLTQSYSFADMYPGKDPEEIKFTLNNKGSLPMRVWMIIKNVSNEENGILDSEQDWYDANGGVKNDLDSAVVYALNVDGNLALEQEAGITVGQVKDSYVNLVKTDIGITSPQYGILDSGEDIEINQKFYLPPETDNWAQSDIMNIEIEILAQQIDAQEPVKQLSFMQNKEAGGGFGTDGTTGVLKYDSMAPEFNYDFVGRGLISGMNYNLVYSPDPWSNQRRVLSNIIVADGDGKIDISGQSVDVGDLPMINDDNSPYGAKIWLVTSNQLLNTTAGDYSSLDWDDTENWLFDNWPGLIRYKQSATSTETVNFSDLGADPQFGPTYDYSNASVGFVYDTPTDDRLSGAITATGLKSDMTYQVKFVGKPTCNYSGGNDDASERIGYKGRWTALGTACSGAGCNRTDEQYEANKALPDGDSAKECIAGYLVWDYITADSLGDITKTVETDNSYHVLWCGGGTCGQSNNSQLSVQSLYPICAESDVNGQIERFSCGSLNLDERLYNLKMVLTEESFHESSYGTWTDVMSTDIDFEIE